MPVANETCGLGPLNIASGLGPFELECLAEDGVSPLPSKLGAVPELPGPDEAVRLENRSSEPKSALGYR